MKPSVIITILFLAYITRELFTLLRLPDRVIHPFPLDREEEITISVYIWIACQYLLFAIFAFLLSRISGHWLFHVVFILQVLELAEYFLTYNKALFTVPIFGHAVNGNVTHLRFLVLAICLVITLIWKT